MHEDERACKKVVGHKYGRQVVIVLSLGSVVCGMAPLRVKCVNNSNGTLFSWAGCKVQCSAKRKPGNRIVARRGWGKHMVAMATLILVGWKRVLTMGPHKL